MTASAVWKQSGEGTEAGLRRAMERLAGLGVLVRQEVAGRVVYSLNDRHVLRPAVDALLDADTRLRDLLRRAIRDWEVAPLSATLFGSAARRDGDEDSDIDVFLVRPLLGQGSRQRTWSAQVRTLKDDVQGWTGNNAHVVVQTSTGLRRMVQNRDPLLDSVLQDAVHLGGERLEERIG